MMTMNGVTLQSCDLPDEYIDAVVSFDSAEMSEAPYHSSKSRVLDSLVPSKWLQTSDEGGVVKKESDQDHANSGMRLCDYDLPDEYVDAAVLSFDDSDANGCENMLPSAGDLLAPIVTPDCLRRKHDSSEDPSDDRNDSSGMALSEYDLPDEYISAEISCSNQREPSEHIPQPQPLVDLDEQFNKILSYEPQVGLSRRRREYTSSLSTNKSTSTNARNNLTYSLSNSQKSPNKADYTSTTEEEWIPEMTVAKGESFLRKRKLSKSAD